MWGEAKLFQKLFIPINYRNGMADNKISMPGAFGGLMRYDEEYRSRFMITPGQVVGFVITIIVLVVAMKLFWPVTA